MSLSLALSREDTGGECNFPTKAFFQDNSCHGIFIPLPVSEVPRGSKNRKINLSGINLELMRPGDVNSALKLHPLLCGKPKCSHNLSINPGMQVNQSINQSISPSINLYLYTKSYHFYMVFLGIVFKTRLKYSKKLLTETLRKQKLTL